MELHADPHTVVLQHDKLCASLGAVQQGFQAHARAAGLAGECTELFMTYTKHEIHPSISSVLRDDSNELYPRLHHR